MNDRERLEAMTRENEDRRAKEAAEEQRREAERKQVQEETAAKYAQKLEELRVYCQDTFGGYKLPTGHEVSVSTGKGSKLHRIGPEEGEYVRLTITHWMPETGDFSDPFPILMCSYKGNGYEYFVGLERKTHGDNLHDFKEVLLRAVAGIGSPELTVLFAAVKDRFRR